MNMISIGGNGITGGGGGPASSIGINLRDYFAGLAMQSMLADPGHHAYGENLAETVRLAYQIADAMLEARGAR